MKIFNLIKDLFAPKKCYSCKKQGYFLCPQCLSTMSMFHPYCYVCKGKSDNFNIHNECRQDIHYDKIMVLTHYKDDIIQKLIKDLKYYGKQDIVEDFGKYIGDLLIENIGDLDCKKSDLVIFPVPMYYFRKLKRGYNHSELLAKSISEYLDIKFNNKLVKRSIDTRQQSKLNAKDRRHNLDEAFVVNKSYLDNVDKKVIVIVDDVISTGTTINEIAKHFKEIGVKGVVGLVVASD